MWKRWTMLYVLAAAGMLIAALAADRAVTAAVEASPLSRSCKIVIDPGHGGFDGGATSCTGVLESSINLEISLCLNDLLHLLGYETIMTRTTDTATNTGGTTIAQRKASDLKERVRLVNSTANAILLSIHQNTFSDSRYSGAQVFYGAGEGSPALAQVLQRELADGLAQEVHRSSKKSQGIFLMEHAQCPAVLIECGFLSNLREEALLRDSKYQQRLCSIIAVSTVSFITQG